MQKRLEKEEKVMQILQNAEPTMLLTMIASLELAGEFKISKVLCLFLQESFSSK